MPPEVRITVIVWPCHAELNRIAALRLGTLVIRVGARSVRYTAKRIGEFADSVGKKRRALVDNEAFEGGLMTSLVIVSFE